MTRRRRRGLLLLLLMLGAISPGPAPLPVVHAQAPPLAAERYKALLAANPVESTALDRLWKLAEERNATGALLDEYRAAASRSPAAALVLGHLLKKAGRLDPAAEAYAQAAALDPASPLPPLALAALANARGDFTRAADAFEAALPKLAPADTRRAAETLLALGAARQAAGDPARAAEAWERAAALDPRDVSLRERLATALEAANEPARAAKQLEFLAANAPAPETRANALRSLGNLHAAQGDFDAARDAFERGLALTAPGNWLRAEFNRARFALHARANRLPELETQLRAGAEKLPRDLGGWTTLAEFYRQSGDTTNERETLEKILALSPRARDPALRLASLLADEVGGEESTAADARITRAIGLLDGLLKIQPGNFDLVLARAELDLRLNRPEPAVARVQAARAARPDDETLGTAALAFFQRHHLAAAAERALQAEVSRRPGAEEPAFALATFLFGQKNADAARAVLDALLTRTPPAERAPRLARAAALCRAQNAPEIALRFAREAAALQPDSAARALELGDAELAANDLPAARAAFENAVNHAPNDNERETAERKLFATFNSEPTASSERPVDRARTGILTGSRAEPAKSELPADPAARAYLERLETLAGEQPRAENLLRLARWQGWRRAVPEALDAARRAVVAEPDNSAARETLARLAADAGDRTLAATTLENLAALDRDTAARARHRRALGKLRLEEGNAEAALAIFTDLEHANPGSREALSDLALAQQAADNWYDALNTWERLYALPGLSPAMRAETRQPLLLALERLGLHERALDILNTALEAQSDPIARQATFRDALALAERHHLLPRLAARAEGRATTARPGETAPLTELATLRRAQGQPAEADALLERAALAAPDPIAATAPGGPLATLVEAAEARADVETAIARQRRLVHLAGASATPDALAKLAELHASAGDPEEAAHVWNALAARFSRDPGALTRAADFFQGADGDDFPRARELLARAVALDPANLARQLRLAELAAASGDQATARAAWEFILARTPAETPADALELADLMPANPAKTGTPLFAPAEGSTTARPVKEERRQRLAAIRGAARSLTHEPADAPIRREWLDRWRAAQAAAPGEALLAFFHAGANEPALELLGRLAVERPTEERLPRVFAFLAIQSHDFTRLAAWLSADPEAVRARREAALEALRQFLPTVTGENRLNPALLSALFPAEQTPREMLWQAANGIFAPVHRYVEAAELGERVLPLVNVGRAAFAVPLARWQLLLHQPARAREILRGVLEDATPVPLADDLGGDEDDGETLPAGDGSDAGLEALRLYHDLLPPGERAGFREAFAARLAAGGRSPARTARTLALLAGLAGDEKGARAMLDRLVALRPTLDARGGLSLAATGKDLSAVGARRWNFLLAVGAKFRAWKMENLALALWRRAAEEALPPGLPAAVTGSPGGNVGPEEAARRDLLARLSALEFTAGAVDPSRPEALAHTIARPGTAGAVGPAAAVVSLLLDSGERRRAAALLTDPAFRRGLADAPPEFWRTWLRNLGAKESGGDPIASENLLRSLLRDRAASPSGLPRRELALALADCLEAGGEFPAAIRVLESALVDASSRETFGRLRLANLCERVGRGEDASRLLRLALRAEPGNSGTRLALASLEERLGHPEATLEILAEAEGLPASAAGAAGAPGGTPVLPPPVTMALGKRLVGAGQAERAVDLARRALRAGQGQTATDIAASFAGRPTPGERVAGQRLLAAVVHHSRDAMVRFNAQAMRLERFATASENPGDFTRELHRLGRLVEESPVMRPAFDALRSRLGTERKELAGQLEADLGREWRECGDLQAGGKLLALLLPQEADGDTETARREVAVKEIVEALRVRPALDETVYGEAANALEAAKRPELAAIIAARLEERFPQNETDALLLGRTRWHAGEQAAAETGLAEWETINAGGDGAFAERLASLWRDLGEPGRAADVLRRALARNPLGWQGTLRAALARLELAAPEGKGQLPVIRALLRAAYADPTCRDLEPALDYLDVAGRLDSAAGAAADLGVPVGLRPGLVAGAFARLETTGRADAARRSVESRPTSLREAPKLVGILRARAMENRDVPALASLAALGERALMAGDAPPVPRLAREMARVYDAWCELAPPDDAAGNVERLRRACALDPADFGRVRRLVECLDGRGQPGEATEALRAFLASPDAAFETAPVDREEAKRLLTARG